MSANYLNGYKVVSVKWGWRTFRSPSDFWHTQCFFYVLSNRFRNKSIEVIWSMSLYNTSLFTGDTIIVIMWLWYWRWNSWQRRWAGSLCCARVAIVSPCLALVPWPPQSLIILYDEVQGNLTPGVDHNCEVTVSHHRSTVIHAVSPVMTPEIKITVL